MVAGGVITLAGVPLALQCHPLQITVPEIGLVPRHCVPTVLQQIQAAVLPHVAVQRLPGALHSVLPFLGFYVHWPAWQGESYASAAALAGHPNPGRAGQHVGLLYVDLGVDPLAFLVPGGVHNPENGQSLKEAVCFQICPHWER